MYYLYPATEKDNRHVNGLLLCQPSTIDSLLIAQWRMARRMSQRLPQEGQYPLHTANEKDLVSLLSHGATPTIGN